MRTTLPGTSGADGTSTRLIVALAGNPYDNRALDAFGQIDDTAANALGGTALTGAQINVGGPSSFYADMRDHEDPWADERTSRVWIQGDLHAQNFGTYMDGSGHLVFDVNDFDEAYLGHVSWDLRRFAASFALLAWRKAFSDEVIGELITVYLDAWLEQVEAFTRSDADRDFALVLGNIASETESTTLRIVLANAAP